MISQCIHKSLIALYCSIVYIALTFLAVEQAGAICTFSTGSPVQGSVTFSNIDPTTNTGVYNDQINAQVFFECNKNDTYFYQLNPATPAFTAGPTIPPDPSIPFALGLAATGLNTANNTSIPLFTLTSSIAPSDFQPMIAGTYTGSITVSICWAVGCPSNKRLDVPLSVTGIVSAVCKEDSALNFGPFISIDPTAGNQTFSPTTDEVVHCAAGRNYRVLVKGANFNTAYTPCVSAGGTGGVRMKFHSSSAPATPDLTYYFSCSNATAGGGGYITGSGQTQLPLGVNLYVAGTDAHAADAVNDYTDSVTLTLEY